MSVEWKKGDKVFCGYRQKEGYIKTVRDGLFYSLVVKLNDCVDVCYYSKDGKPKNGEQPSLVRIAEAEGCYRYSYPETVDLPAYCIPHSSVKIGQVRVDPCSAEESIVLQVLDDRVSFVILGQENLKVQNLPIHWFTKIYNNLKD